MNTIIIDLLLFYSVSVVFDPRIKICHLSIGIWDSHGLLFARAVLSSLCVCDFIIRKKFCENTYATAYPKILKRSSVLITVR